MHNGKNTDNFFERLFRCFFAGSACMGDDYEDDAITVTVNPVKPAAIEVHPLSELNAPAIETLEAVAGEPAPKAIQQASVPEIPNADPKSGEIHVSNEAVAESSEKQPKSPSPVKRLDNTEALENFGWVMLEHARHLATDKPNAVTFSSLSKNINNKSESDDEWVNLSPVASPARRYSPPTDNGGNLRRRHT